MPYITQCLSMPGERPQEKASMHARSDRDLVPLRSRVQPEQTKEWLTEHDSGLQVLTGSVKV